jgi:predicted signal transduction protein with EAL and GGDEF domain
MGDRLLQEVVRRLLASVRERDTVARLGGDEFVVMLENLGERAGDAGTQCRSIGEKILATLNLPYDLAGYEYHNTPSIGVALFGGARVGTDELMKRADLAMYEAKASGRNTLRFFDPKMQAVVTARVALEKDLREALQQQSFFLCYQAQVDDRGRVIGAEALVRWQHAQRGMISPNQFIPLAEETGLILPLGLWVLETACAQAAIWAAQPGREEFTVSVNVSARQFRQPNFVDLVLAVLADSGASPRNLKLELTESLLLDNMQDAIGKMSALKKRGVGFSLDDFGTGYSSLSYLKRLPFDQLKIDQSFVRDLLTDANDKVIADTIIALAHSLGLAVIAEGVESVDQRAALAARGCNAYQGYLFSRPLPLADFNHYLQLHPIDASGATALPD